MKANESDGTNKMDFSKDDALNVKNEALIFRKCVGKFVGTLRNANESVSLNLMRLCIVCYIVLKPRKAKPSGGLTKRVF